MSEQDPKKEVGDKSESRRNRPSSSYDMVRRMWPLLLAYAGMGIAGLPFLGVDFDTIMRNVDKFALPVLGGAIVLGAVFQMMRDLERRRGERFVDVDFRGRSEASSQSVEALVREIQEIKKAQGQISVEQAAHLVQQSVDRLRVADENSLKTFRSYFNLVRTVLEQKASIADEKASILLDKGTAYSRWGIIFFVATIIGWQVLSWVHGFQVQFIYGIVSCSLLFIFIEFLSAWFLKQYRNFIDTSTYLIKVKSIFDRYMLTYLAAVEFQDLDAKKRHGSNQILELLSHDIKWPDSYILKSADVSFARESLEAMTGLLAALQNQKKANSKQPAEEA